MSKFAARVYFKVAFWKMKSLPPPLAKLFSPILCRESGYKYQILWAAPFIDRLGTE
jgi:hypothetical protein